MCTCRYGAVSEVIRAQQDREDRANRQGQLVGFFWGATWMYVMSWTPRLWQHVHPLAAIALAIGVSIFVFLMLLVAE